MPHHSWNEIRRIAGADRLRKISPRLSWAERLTRPLRRLPGIGSLVYVFWFCVLSEGDPRNGLIFSFLNDRMHPTLWNTWHQVVDDEFTGPYIGLWVPRAPRNARHADRLRAANRERVRAAYD